MVLLLRCPGWASCGGESTLKVKQWKKQGNKSRLNLSRTIFLLGLGFSKFCFVFCLKSRNENSRRNCLHTTEKAMAQHASDPGLQCRQ